MDWMKKKEDVKLTKESIFKDCNAVLIIVDPTRIETWKYAKKLMDKIPSTMYTLVLANFRDLDPKSFLIPTFHIKQYCFSKGGNFSFLESSMKNCYGLTGVKTFLSLPFLKVREKFLKSLVEKNKEEIDTARYEVDYLIENLKYEKMNNTSTDEDTVKPESNPIQKKKS